MSWVQCTACGLKHAARADGICPRCQAQAGQVLRAGEVAGRRSAAVTRGASTDAQRSRRVAGIAFLVFGAFKLIAVFARGFGMPGAAVDALIACCDLGLGALLLGDEGWVRSAAITWAGLHLVGATVSPFVLARASNLFIAISLMVFFFCAGMLVLLPGSAGRARRWTGVVFAFLPYTTMKFLFGILLAAERGHFDFREYAGVVRVFLQLG